MIKIEFPADRPDIARAMAKALHRIGYAEDVPSMSTDDVQVAHEGPKQPASLSESTEGEHTEKSGDTNSDVNAESAFGTAQTAETSSPAPSTSDARVDEKGVGFNGAFCGEAKEPFYASGKMKGQWKKRKGVDQGDYDAWYEGELGKLSTPSHTEAHATAPAADSSSTISEPATVNAATAFGAPQQAEAEEPVPTDAGSLMVWISEKQAAGRLTQDDVNDAYQVTGVNTAALFGDNAAPHIAAIHTFLSAKVS